VIKHVRLNKTGHNWFSWIPGYRFLSVDKNVISSANFAVAVLLFLPGSLFNQYAKTLI